LAEVDLNRRDSIVQGVFNGSTIRLRNCGRNALGIEYQGIETAKVFV
jgi:hypothetical protein